MPGPKQPNQRSRVEVEQGGSEQEKQWSQYGAKTLLT